MRRRFRQVVLGPSGRPGRLAPVGTFIENVYDRQRLHSALAYLSPTELEAKPPVAAAQLPLALTP